VEQIENKRGEIIGEYAAAIKELWKRHTSDEYNEKTKFLRITRDLILLIILICECFFDSQFYHYFFAKFKICYFTSTYLTMIHHKSIVGINE